MKQRPHPPAAGPRPRVKVEVRVFPGRVEVNDLEGSDLGPRLTRKLERLGVRTARRFESPCG